MTWGEMKKKAEELDIKDDTELYLGAIGYDFLLRSVEKSQDYSDGTFPKLKPIFVLHDCIVGEES